MPMIVPPELYHQLPENPVEKLLIAFDSQQHIADYCSVSPQAVHNWKSRESIPYVYITDLSRFSGLPEWLLCPKHFEKGESNADVQFAGESSGLRGEVQGGSAGGPVRPKGVLQAEHGREAGNPKTSGATSAEKKQ